MSGDIDHSAEPGTGIDELLAGHPTLAAYLAGRRPAPDPATLPFRMVVESVSPAGAGLHSIAGTVLSGAVAAGDEVVLAPSGQRCRVTGVVVDGGLAGAGTHAEARAGASATLEFGEELDIAAGFVVGSSSSPPQVARMIQATIAWLHDEPLLRGRSYALAPGAGAVTATVAPVRYKLSPDSLAHVAATKLERGEVGVCDLELSAPIAVDAFSENRHTGTFTLVDRITGETVGAGLIEFVLRRSANIRWQVLSVDRTARAAAMGQTPGVLWFTGLSGSGKSTVANRVEADLHRRGHHTYLLDGDNVRHGLNRDLGFTDADRVENIRRVAEVSKLMVDAGLIVLVSFISPFASERRMARALFEPGQFFEVFVDTPLAVAEQRDPKGLYAKARRGELVNFTGIDSPYERPQRPELHLEMVSLSPERAAADVIGLLEAGGLVPAR